MKTNQDQILLTFYVKTAHNHTVRFECTLKTNKHI
jgi:hypothetical protein